MTARTGLYCKSFRGDFVPLRLMLDTFARHNPSNLPLTLSLPQTDIESFENEFGTTLLNVNVVADESYVREDLSGIPGWLGQQVCKLNSWRAHDYDHYLVLDSDCYFIRDIGQQDMTPREGKQFIACGSRLRTVLLPDNADLIRFIGGEFDSGARFLPDPPPGKIDRLGKYRNFLEIGHSQVGALERSDIPFKIFGRTDWVFFQPGQIFSRALIEELCQYLSTYHLTPSQAIHICPWEYNWYGEFAAGQRFEETEFRISPFIHFQRNEDVQFAHREGITVNKLASRFAIIQMAARHVDALSL